MGQDICYGVIRYRNCRLARRRINPSALQTRQWRAKGCSGGPILPSLGKPERCGSWETRPGSSLTDPHHSVALFLLLSVASCSLHCSSCAVAPTMQSGAPQHSTPAPTPDSHTRTPARPRTPSEWWGTDNVAPRAFFVLEGHLWALGLFSLSLSSVWRFSITTRPSPVGWPCRDACGRGRESCWLGPGP